tara:strand:- start:3088 stop:4380 length:1293 start_codon:yes stop_codon:yes gene_type:complete
MFSAVFGAAARPERIRFLHEVKAAFPVPVNFVVFNTSETVEADFPVVNAARGLNPQFADPLETLQALLTEHCPGKVDLLLDHARGELGYGLRVFDQMIRKHIRMILAFCRALDAHDPDYVYLWNQFNALHRTFEAILQHRGIKMGFFHDGVLPGSIALDVDGEMGESWIAKDPEKFMSVEVSEAQVARAAAFMASQAGMENNRHPQVEEISVAQSLALAKLGDRPVMFFAGQNDWHAGIKPKSPARAFHSPFFAGSMEALETLDRIAGEIGLAIVFKPHPLSRDRFAFLRANEFPNTVILQHTSMNVCIDLCDVAATIASQACYVALQENTPVMMLGRNQLTGKGLTYDVTNSDMIAATLRTALDDPLEGSRAQDLAVHAAQLEQAYLFDYGTQDAGFYTRGAADMARLMHLSVREPVEDVIEAIVDRTV